MTPPTRVKSYQNFKKKRENRCISQKNRDIYDFSLFLEKQTTLPKHLFLIKIFLIYALFLVLFVKGYAIFVRTLPTMTVFLGKPLAEMCVTRHF